MFKQHKKHIQRNRIDRYQARATSLTTDREIDSYICVWGGTGSLEGLKATLAFVKISYTTNRAGDSLDNLLRIRRHGRFEAGTFS